MHDLQRQLNAQRRLYGVRVHERLLCVRRRRKSYLLGLLDRRPGPARHCSLHVDVRRNRCELRRRHMVVNGHAERELPLLFRLELRGRQLHGRLHHDCRHLLRDLRRRHLVDDCSGAEQ